MPNAYPVHVSLIPETVVKLVEVGSNSKWHCLTLMFWEMSKLRLTQAIATRIGHARVNLSSVTIYSFESNAVKRPGFADVEA